MQDILEKLKDDVEYYGEFGSQYISNSDIDTLINNPKAYGEPTPDNVNFLFGKAFHELVMFGETQHDTYVDASTRTTKIYKEAVAEHGSILLLKKEYDNLQYCVQAVLDSKEAKELLSDGSSQYEVPNVGELFPNSQGVYWKGKADVVTDEFIIDLKTTSSKLSKFKSSAMTYNYDSQAFVYESLWKKSMKFIVVEKDTQAIGIFDVSERSFGYGQEKAYMAQESYIKHILNKEEFVYNGSI